jgi:hypothetical protein
MIKMNGFATIESRPIPGPKDWVLRRLAMALIPSLALSVSVAATDIAAAQGRPDTSRMSCASARQLVSRHGAIVLSTGPSTFDRFVSNRSYCMPTEQTEPAFVRTTDNRQCFVGYTCREPEHDVDR